MTKTTKLKKAYICNTCQADYPRWQGQCTSCADWNTISEVTINPNATLSVADKATNIRSGASSSKVGGYGGAQSKQAINPSQIKARTDQKFKTGLGEFARVMGDGVTVGSATLVSGSPGAGKTTLLTKLTSVFSQTKVVLYATAEENDNQWKARQERVGHGYVDANVFLITTDSLDDILNEAANKKADILIIDSIQAVVSSSVDGQKGSISQVKECGSEITKFAKANNVTTFVVGQVTKDNTAAGPKVLEHTIDTHIHLEKSDHSNLRTLRSNKNRFGSEESVGLFKMEGDGLHPIDDPCSEFRSASGVMSSGSAIACLRSANRNILLEIQALVVDSQSDKLQRVCLGVNYNRIQLITAILKKHCMQSFYADIFVSVVGGLRISEQDTSTDLTIAAALVSSLKDKPIDDKTCFIGELTLSGEVKTVPNGESRLKEASRHGFNKIYAAKSLAAQIKDKSIKSKIIPITNIRELMNEFR